MREIYITIFMRDQILVILALGAQLWTRIRSEKHEAEGDEENANADHECSEPANDEVEPTNEDREFLQNGFEVDNYRNP